VLWMGCKKIRYYVQRGMPVKDALDTVYEDKVYKNSGIGKEALALAYNGSHTSFRKALKRLRAAGIS
jgi:hypothetical protein